MRLNPVKPAPHEYRVLTSLAEPSRVLSREELIINTARHANRSLGQNDFGTRRRMLPASPVFRSCLIAGV
jgi:hypothetical protein